MQLESMHDRIIEVLDQHGLAVAAAYLFGSVAIGRAGPESDVDIAILFAEAPAATLDAPPMRIEGQLERALRKPVQVVDLSRAPVDLSVRVLRFGRLIHETDRAARIRFEVGVRNAFFDLEPILRRYRRTERPVP